MKKIILSLTLLSIIGTTTSFGTVSHKYNQTPPKKEVAIMQNNCKCKTCIIEKQKKQQQLKQQQQQLKKQQTSKCKTCQQQKKTAHVQPTPQKHFKK